MLEKILEKYKNYEELQINAKNHKNKTPLHIASEKGYEESLKLLVDHGAELNMKDLNKNTPLHILCKTGNVDLIEHLLKSDKLDLKVKDKEGKMPFQIL